MAGYRYSQLNKNCPFLVGSLNGNPSVSKRHFRDDGVLGFTCFYGDFPAPVFW